MDHDPGSIVAPDDRGVYTLSEELHGGPRLLAYTLASDPSDLAGYPRTTLTQSEQPVWTNVCTENVSQQAFDCQMSVAFSWAVTRATPDGFTQDAPCTTQYAGSLRFRRSTK